MKITQDFEKKIEDLQEKGDTTLKNYELFEIFLKNPNKALDPVSKVRGW